jgi:hypothetical protein
METLGKIFGSIFRVRILRLFLFNPDTVYEMAEIAARAKVSKITLQNEIAVLNRAGFTKRKSFYKQVLDKKAQRCFRPSQSRRKKHVLKKKRAYGWTLNEKFPHLAAIKEFLINAAPVKDRDIAKKLRRAGTFKLLVVAGVFMQNFDSRLDILIVGDRINQSQLERSIKNIEAELGRELRYALFGVNDFRYRLGVHDRLIRDVFDYPHRNIVDRIGVEFHPRSEIDYTAEASDGNKFLKRQAGKI